MIENRLRNIKFSFLTKEHTLQLINSIAPIRRVVQTNKWIFNQLLDLMIFNDSKSIDPPEYNFETLQDSFIGSFRNINTTPNPCSEIALDDKPKYLDQKRVEKDTVISFGPKSIILWLPILNSSDILKLIVNYDTRFYFDFQFDYLAARQVFEIMKIICFDLGIFNKLIIVDNEQMKSGFLLAFCSYILASAEIDAAALWDHALDHSDYDYVE